MSLPEYQSQLADIEILLADAPDEESLLKLKSDLLELIELTQAGEMNNMPDTAIAGRNTAIAGEESPMGTNGAKISDVQNPSDEAGTMEVKPNINKKAKKKLKKPFEIPEHLLPLESDTEAQRNKKKRTIKSLKSKHKAAQKEYESNQKQNAWLDFSKKKRKKGRSGGESIFKTTEGGGKVGVIAGTNDGNIGSSKRQRHTF